MEARLITEVIIGLLIAAVVGGVAYSVGRRQAKDEGAVLRAQAEKALSEAQAKARQILIEAKDEILREREAFERELKDRRAELQREEDRLKRRREELEQMRERNEKRERQLNQRQSQLDKREAEIDKLQREKLAALEQRLQEVANMTREQAREELLNAVRESARQDMARIIREVEAEARETAEQRARRIIVETMQRVATEVVAERAVTVVELPSEEAKGRIIGRNGRNVQTFEQIAGVDIIVDDTPEAVTISCFDPVRREIARRALEALVRDGRIHPSRIEKALEDARREVERIMAEEGERAALEAGVPGLPSEIIKTLGRLKYAPATGKTNSITPWRRRRSPACSPRS